jgi:hypothetical protein
LKTLHLFALITTIAFLGLIHLQVYAQTENMQNNGTQFSNNTSQTIVLQWPPQPAIQHITIVIGVNNTVKWVKEGLKDDTITADNNNDPDFAKAAPYLGNHFDGTLVNSTQVGLNETEIFYKDQSGQVRSFFSESARYAHNMLDEKNPFFQYTFTRVGTFGYHGEPWERCSVTVLAPLYSASVPEFQSVFPVLLIGIMSLIVFHGLKIR